ncbi:hypothetical protein KY289_020677 [Solanum tuberosum]|nr:hypothetical protein KY289_020677 [Solanum tuberosum]
MDQLMPQLAPTAYPISQPSHLVHSTSHPASTEQDSSQQVPTVQAPFKKRIGRESQSYWTVEAIDSENNVKRLKHVIALYFQSTLRSGRVCLCHT